MGREEIGGKIKKIIQMPESEERRRRKGKGKGEVGRKGGVGRRIG